MRLIEWGYYVNMLTASRQWRSVPGSLFILVFIKGLKMLCHLITPILSKEHFMMILSVPLLTLLLVLALVLKHLFSFIVEWLRWAVQHIDWSNCRVHSHALCLHRLSHSVSFLASLSPSPSYCLSLYLNSHWHMASPTVCLFFPLLFLLKMK